LGDIKTVWELSRFEWVVQLAIIASTGDKNALNQLNKRLNNWLLENELYKGVNWKCGQESSIRLMHLIIAAIILNQLDSPSLSFINLIEVHIKRIAPTISYAIAQNNNHGTSEAAALFVGGNFLTSNGLYQYRMIENVGRKWLENRAKKLFSDDGCFSQYSVNYHRLVLDTYCFCENYRRLKNLTEFTPDLYFKIRKATTWLESITDINTGDVPNIGANDGARLFNFFNYDYRDFRPTLQWANLLFFKRLVYEVSYNQSILYNLLGLNADSNKKNIPIQKSLIMGDNDGFFIYKNEKILVVFRRPIFKFRPSHSDALHIDLWINNINYLRDGGSYSYNTNNEKIEYYTGTKSHNTIEIDEKSQMKKISRFLFGSWLSENKFDFKTTKNELFVKSGYKDKNGIMHYRSLLIKGHNILITDFVDGFKKSANLVYRLPEENWILKTRNTNNSNLEIDLNSKIISGALKLNSEVESRYYFNESTISVLSLKLDKKQSFITNIKY